MNSIKTKSILAECLLGSTGLKPKPCGVWRNPAGIMYHFFKTEEGKVAVKYDFKVFEHFGELYDNKCMEGDSFDAWLVEEMDDIKAFMTVKPQGVYGITLKKILKVGIKRYNRFSNSYTYTFAMDQYKRLSD